MEPQQFAKKPAIPLAHDQRTPRCGNFAQTSNATALEVITKGDPLQRSDTMAQARRSSRVHGQQREERREQNQIRQRGPFIPADSPAQDSSKARRSALTLTHPRIGAASLNRTADTPEPNARTIESFPKCGAETGKARRERNLLLRLIQLPFPEGDADTIEGADQTKGNG